MAGIDEETKEVVVNTWAELAKYQSALVYDVDGDSGLVACSMMPDGTQVTGIFYIEGDLSGNFLALSREGPSLLDIFPVTIYNPGRQFTITQTCPSVGINYVQ